MAEKGAITFGSRPPRRRLHQEEVRPQFYQSIGKKGGQTTKQRHGPEFYEKIGKKAASALGS